MTGQYAYFTNPYPFNISVIVAGFYAGGLYYEIEADQFVSKDALELYSALLFQHWEPYPFPRRNCMSCEKTCHNLTVYGDCCSYVPMLGLQGVVSPVVSR